MRISGHTDRADREFVSGWVIDLDDPLKRISLEILAGEVSLGRCVANTFREDLARSKIGDGHCSFKFKVPVPITEDQAKHIQFRIVGVSDDQRTEPAPADAKRLGYLAVNAGSVPFTARTDGKYVLQNTGGNTGNLAFWYAARRLFDHPIAFVEWNPDNLYSKDLIDKLVIPAANHLNPAWNHEPLALLVERLGKEVIVFGLGSQAENESDPINLSAGTVRYLRVLSEHAKTLFVRGEFTAELCARYGVRNVEPLGCPSILINPDPELGALVSARWRNKVERLYCAGAAFKSNTGLLEAALFAHIKALPGSTYVLQDQEELIDCAAGYGSRAENLDVGAKIAALVDPGAEARAFLQTFRRVARCYSSVRAWLEAAAAHSHSVSTRIHGAILSLMAGVPTLVIAHDARMRELCQSMALPWLRQGEALQRLDSLDKLFAEVEFDGQRFDARRRVIASRYVEYLEGVGVRPSQVLCRLGMTRSPGGGKADLLATQDGRLRPA